MKIEIKIFTLAYISFRLLLILIYIALAMKSSGIDAISQVLTNPKEGSF